MDALCPCNGRGIEVGTLPGATDDYNGAGTSPDAVIYTPGVFAYSYYQNGVAPGDFPVWEGPTGFYSDNWRGPITPGGSKTWSDIYLFALGNNPGTPGQVAFAITSEDMSRVPWGYTAHIVLDQIPASANWTGPTDFWIDLSQTAGQNVFVTLPIATLADPSQVLTQGTEMSITVYAPVPEPSSFLPLIGGMIGMASFALRRRQL